MLIAFQIYYWLEESSGNYIKFLEESRIMRISSATGDFNISESERWDFNGREISIIDINSTENKLKYSGIYHEQKIIGKQLEDVNGNQLWELEGVPSDKLPKIVKNQEHKILNLQVSFFRKKGANAF